MSKVDQLRALRDAKYARKNALPPAASVAEAPAEPEAAPKKAKAKKKKGAVAPKR